MELLDKVNGFHNLLKVTEYPDANLLSSKLVREEINEFWQAVDDHYFKGEDINNIAAEAADIIYVLNQYLLVRGLSLKEALQLKTEQNFEKFIPEHRFSSDYEIQKELQYARKRYQDNTINVEYRGDTINGKGYYVLVRSDGKLLKPSWVN